MSLVTWMRRLARPRTAPDARVAVLANELTLACVALAKASEAMKRQTVTPVLITQTRAAARRAESALGQLGLLPAPAQSDAKRPA